MGTNIHRYVIVCFLFFSGGINFLFSQETFTLSSPQPVLEYYSFDSDLVIPRQFALSVETSSNRNYRVKVGFTAGMSGNPVNRLLYSAGGDTIGYMVVDSASSGNILKDLPDNPTNSEMLTGSVRRNSPADFTFDVILTGGFLPPAGNYSDNLLVKAYLTNDTFLTQAAFPVSVIVPPFVGLSLVSSGGVYDPGSKSYFLDFGFLEEGERGFFDMVVRANIPYSIEVTSANRGNFAHTEPADASVVPYSMRLDSGSVNLASGTAVINTGSGPTPVAGSRHQIEIEIQNVDAASSGFYEDTLQITVTAR